MLRHLSFVLGYPAIVVRHRYLVANFFRRELLGRFRGSFLGLFWVLVHPIFLFVIYYLVFGLLFGNWKRGEPPDPSFAIYLFSGVVAFQALIEATARSCTSVVENGNLVKKVAFPSELLPLHSCLLATVVYLVGASVCFVAGVGFGVLHPGWSLLCLPLVLLVQFILALGLGLLLANLQVFARDTSHLWSIVATSWLFVSPVFWYPNLLTAKFGSGAETLFALNPAHHLLQAHRIALGARDTALPNGEVIAFGNLWEHLLWSGAWALGLLVLGHTAFMSRRHKFADLV
jgi:lipopolysaccharide transport system permease protein